MAKIKSYSDLQQSKKLAEILPLESADMHYNDWMYDFYDGYEHTGAYMPNLGTPITICGELDVPCWSLAALLGVLPKIVNHETLFIENSAALWHIGYRNIYTARADNPVDACYEMVLKLNELKML